MKLDLHKDGALSAEFTNPERKQLQRVFLLIDRLAHHFRGTPEGEEMLALANGTKALVIFGGLRSAPGSGPAEPPPAAPPAPDASRSVQARAADQAARKHAAKVEADAKKGGE